MNRRISGRINSAYTINNAIATAAMGKGIPQNDIEHLQVTLHQLRDRRCTDNKKSLII